MDFNGNGERVRCWFYQQGVQFVSDGRWYSIRLISCFHNYNSELMKKILLFLLLVFPIVAKAQLELPFSIKLVNSAPIDFWYFESDGTPYDNTGEVTTQVLSAIRYIGQTFNVNGVEYWFKDGITDGDLITKGGGSVDTTAFIKTQGTSILTDDIIVDADTMDISIYSDGGFGFNSTYQPDGIHEWGLGFNQQLYSYPQAGPGTEVLQIMSYRIGIFDAGGADYAIDIQPSPATWRNKIPSGYTYSIVGSGYENMFSVDSFLGNIDIGNSGTTLTLPNIPAASGQTYAVVVDDTGLVSSQAIGGGGGGLTVGTSTITSGTNTKVLYNNSGVLGEYTVSGTGNVALTTSPVFTTPNIGTATGTASGNYSLASGGTATGKNTFAMGSNPFILTSGVTTGTGATAGIQNVFNSLTTGNGLDISSSSVSSGAIVKITGTGTAAASNTQRGLVVDVSGANATSSQTTYGGYFSDTKTGTGSTNIGLYATATGGTTNYAIYSNGIIYTNSDLRLLSGNSINWDANGDKIIKIQSNVMTLSTFGDFAFRTWGGAAYAERFRISDTYTAIGGGTSATAFRFLEPSGSGTNYSSFKAVAQSANINYSLPPTVAVAGAVLTDVAGNGVLTWEEKSLQSATNTKTEKVIYNVGTIGSAATSTYSIHTESYYANGTTLLAKITVVAVKTDGSASAHSTVTARFRKNSSGTWSVDDAGTDITSDITILADVVGDFSTNPNVKVTMGAASGNYNVSWVAETIEVK